MLIKSRECVPEGFRSSDNCYKLLQSHTCHKTSLDKAEIWHQKLSHLNFKNMTKIVNIGVVRGVPKLGKKQLGICEPCQLGKQLKGTHKVL